MNINNQFFDGIYQEVWRRIIPAGLSEAEVDFIEEMGSLEKGEHILDIMCGYGRHALELAKRGYAVTAIDNAAEYISEIQSKAEVQQLPVQARHGSILDVELDREYKAIVCMGNSFAFFSEEEALSIARKLSEHITKGGVFIINTWAIAEIAIRHFKEKEWHELDGFKYLIAGKFLFNPTRIESIHTIIDEDKTIEDITGIDYILTLSELQKLFKTAGFSFSGIYSTPRKRAFNFGDTRAYILFQKD